MEKSGKITFWFIGGAVVIGTIAYFINKHYKVKMNETPSIDNDNVAPKFEGIKDEKIHDVVAEEEIKQEPVKKQPSRQDIFFSNASSETIQKRIVQSFSMDNNRKRRLINAIKNLNSNPTYRNEKIKIYNLSNGDMNYLQKVIFDWAINYTKN